MLLQQHSEEEFVKFPERRLGDLGQRKMFRLCICSSCVSQEPVGLHPKLLQFLISVSLSPAHQASQNVIQLSKATTYHSANRFAPSCSVSVPGRLTAPFLLIPYFNFPKRHYLEGGIVASAQPGSMHSLHLSAPGNTLGL